jgi:hypothetical protein
VTAQAVSVLTRKSKQHLFRDSGTGDWVADGGRVEKCDYVVCVRNSHGMRSPEDEIPHATGFLIGRHLSVAPSGDDEDRIVIRFREFAEVNVPNCWSGNRNPVRYGPLEELLPGVDPDALQWQPFPEHLVAPPEVKPLSIAEAKRAIAAKLGVREDQIEVIVRA